MRSVRTRPSRPDIQKVDATPNGSHSRRAEADQHRVSLWLGFVALATVDIITPGPAIVLAVNNGAAYGVRRTLWSTFGNEVGLLAHGVVGGVGVAAALEALPGLLLTMQVMGAAYLTWLGVSRLRRPRDDTSANNANPSAVNRQSLIRTGFGTAALNPRPFLFFAALLPQFVHPERPFGMHWLTRVSGMAFLGFAAHLAAQIS